MQDNPASRPYRMHDLRECLDCPARFTPTGNKQVRCPDCQAARAAVVTREAHVRALAKRKADRAAARLTGPVCSYGDCKAPLRRNNTLGRCQEHRYIGEGMGECGVDGCEVRLRRDNKIGFCEEHKYATAREPERSCAADGCERTLQADNRGGYCPGHIHLSERSREYRERYYARLRQENSERPDTREVCSVGECENRLRSDNTIGRCGEHYYLPLDLAECEVDSCENRLTTVNALGRCTEHRGEYWALDAPRCAAKGCRRTLNADNAIGYCREHRYLSPARQEYNREYYRETQATRLEYARLYREVYTEEHRETSRRWARENPALRSAARMRRRMRAREGLTDLDLLMSLARCMEMTGEPCFYCGAPSEEVEHFFPLCKGGTDAWQNILPSCMPCNHGTGGKHDTCGTAFMLRRGTWKQFLPPEPALNPPTV